MFTGTREFLAATFAGTLETSATAVFWLMLAIAKLETVAADVASALAEVALVAFDVASVVAVDKDKDLTFLDPLKNLPKSAIV